MLAEDVIAGGIAMAQILVRNLDDGIVEQLRRKAQAHDRSLEAEVRRVLGEAAGSPVLDHDAAVESLAAFRKKLKGRKLPDTTAEIREERDA